MSFFLQRMFKSGEEPLAVDGISSRGKSNDVVLLSGNDIKFLRNSYLYIQ